MQTTCNQITQGASVSLFGQLGSLAMPCCVTLVLHTSQSPGCHVAQFVLENWRSPLIFQLCFCFSLYNFAFMLILHWSLFLYLFLVILCVPSNNFTYVPSPICLLGAQWAVPWCLWSEVFWLEPSFGISVGTWVRYLTPSSLSATMGGCPSWPACLPAFTYREHVEEGVKRISSQGLIKYQLSPVLP